MATKINATIFSLKDGYEKINNVKTIKIKCKDYGLVIMEDYLPVIGEINGDVAIISEDDERVYENISGFYRHSHNEFELLIKNYV